MTGPERYREAERLIAKAETHAPAGPHGAGRPVEAIAYALTAVADALLALTAATLEAAPVDPNTLDPNWVEVMAKKGPPW